MMAPPVIALYKLAYTLFIYLLTCTFCVDEHCFIKYGYHLLLLLDVFIYHVIECFSCCFLLSIIRLLFAVQFTSCLKQVGGLLANIIVFYGLYYSCLIFAENKVMQLKSNLVMKTYQTLI